MYADLRYHITSGDTEQVTEKLDKGLLDFAVLCETPDPEKYDYVEFTEDDIWGVVMRRDHPLATRDCIRLDDLIGQPLFCSEQSWNYEIREWAGERWTDLDLAGTFRLSYNGSMFALEGLGLLLTFRHLTDCSPESWLAFIPLEPVQNTRLYLVRNRYVTCTPIAQKFFTKISEPFR